MSVCVAVRVRVSVSVGVRMGVGCMVVVIQSSQCSTSHPVTEGSRRMIRG